LDTLLLDKNILLMNEWTYDSITHTFTQQVTNVYIFVLYTCGCVYIVVLYTCVCGDHQYHRHFALRIHHHKHHHKSPSTTITWKKQCCFKFTFCIKDGKQQHHDIHHIKHMIIVDSSSFYHINMNTINLQALYAFS
jgi:hypothetical protein